MSDSTHGPIGVGEAEARRLEAERYKLELEAREIERRLNARWWESQRLSQYLFAVLITSVVLFGWTKAYLEPILRRENEIYALEQQRNETLYRLLEAQKADVEKQKAVVDGQKKELEGELSAAETESQQLEATRTELEAERADLRKVVIGLNKAVEHVANGEGKFFSLMNGDDPIWTLSNEHGWHMYSTDKFRSLGYYLLADHPKVLGGSQIIICRAIEIDKMKRDYDTTWQSRITEVTRQFPIIALDYSYFALLEDPTAPVGGMIYTPHGEEIEFHAALADWSPKLGAILRAN